MSKTLGMKFKFKKCYDMHVGRKNEAHTYYMDGKPLLHTFEEKDVGVMITEN